MVIGQMAKIFKVLVEKPNLVPRVDLSLVPLEEWLAPTSHQCDPSHAERESQHLYPCQEVLAGPGVQILPTIIRWASGQGTQVTIGGLTPTLETSLLGKESQYSYPPGNLTDSECWVAFCSVEVICVGVPVFVYTRTKAYYQKRCISLYWVTLP